MRKTREFLPLLKSDRLLLLAVILGLVDISLFLYSYGVQIGERAVGTFHDLFEISSEEISSELSKLNPIEPVEIEAKMEITNDSIHYFESGNTKGDRAREIILNILKEGERLEDYLKGELNKENCTSPLISLSVLDLNGSLANVEAVRYYPNPSLSWIENFRHFIVWFGWGNKLSWQVDFTGSYSNANCLSIGFKTPVSGRIELSFPGDVEWYSLPRGGTGQFHIALSGTSGNVSFEAGYGDKFMFCWVE